MVQGKFSAWVTTELWVDDLANKNLCLAYNFHVKFFQNPRVPTPSISHLFSLSPSRLSPPIPGECPGFVLNYQSVCSPDSRHQTHITFLFPLNLKLFHQILKGSQVLPLISPFSPKTLVERNIIKHVPYPNTFLPELVSVFRNSVSVV